MDKYSNMVNTTTPYAWDDSMSLYEFIGNIVERFNKFADILDHEVQKTVTEQVARELGEFTEDRIKELIRTGQVVEVVNQAIMDKLHELAVITPEERDILDRAFDLTSDIVPRLEALDVPLLENLEQRFDNLIATPVPTGEIIAEEIIDARDGEVSVGAKIRSVDAQLAQIIHVPKPKGNQVEDTIILNEAFSKLVNGGVLRFPDSQTYIVGNINHIIKGDIFIEMNNSHFVFPSGSLIKLSGEQILTTNLASNGALHTNRVTLSTAAGVQVGDIIYIANDTVAETGWNESKKFLSTVKSVSGNVVEINDNLHFPFLASESGNIVTIHRPQHVVVNGLSFTTQTTTTTNHLRFDFLSVNLNENRQDNSDSAYGILLNRCVNSRIDNVYVKGGTYPILIGCCRNINLFNLHNIGKPIRHLVAIASWSADIFIDGVYGPGGLVESHPAFNVNYKNVDITTTTEFPWNFRSIGGSLKNSRIKQSGERATDLMVQRLSLVDTSLWEHSTFTMDEVVVDTLEQGGYFTVFYGYDINIKNCTFPDGTTLRVGASSQDAPVKRLRLSNNKGITNIENRTSDFQVITDKVVSDAILKDGTYEIDSWMNTVIRNENSKDARWENKGQITTDNNSSDPLVIPLKIYIQNRKGSYGFNFVYLTIKLTALLHHTNSGNVDIQENTYHAYVNVLTGTAIFPTTPASASESTGFTNESLSISVGNVTASGSAQNLDGASHFIGFDVTLTSGRTAPKYSLYYDINYYGMRT